MEERERGGGGLWKIGLEAWFIFMVIIGLVRVSHVSWEKEREAKIEWNGSTNQVALRNSRLPYFSQVILVARFRKMWPPTLFFRDPRGPNFSPSALRDATLDSESPEEAISLGEARERKLVDMVDRWKNCARVLRCWILGARMPFAHKGSPNLASWRRYVGLVRDLAKMVASIESFIPAMTCRKSRKR